MQLIMGNKGSKQVEQIQNEIQELRKYIYTIEEDKVGLQKRVDQLEQVISVISMNAKSVEEDKKLVQKGKQELVDVVKMVMYLSPENEREQEKGLKNVNNEVDQRINNIADHALSDEPTNRIISSAVRAAIDDTSGKEGKGKFYRQVKKIIRQNSKNTDSSKAAASASNADTIIDKETLTAMMQTVLQTKALEKWRSSVKK